MKTSSRLRLFCGFALFAVAFAGQARADQEISAVYNKSTTPSFYNTWVFPGWATCQGVPTPWNCVNTSDYVGYLVYADWDQGLAYAARADSYQVSPGDTAFVQIALWCDDGSFGHNYGTGSGPDGGGPPVFGESYCFTASGDYGTAYEVTFTYGVATTGAS